MQPARTSPAKINPPPLSAALIESLRAHRSAALSAELLQRPDIGLAAVVHAFASRALLQNYGDGGSLEITASAQSFRRVEGSKALESLQAARENWGQKAPGTTDDR